MPSGISVTASEVIDAYETLRVVRDNPQLAGLAVLALPGHVVGRAGLVEAHLTIARAIREMDAVVAAKPNSEKWSGEEQALYAALDLANEAEPLRIADLHEASGRLLCGGGSAS
jgi:hypothetical protein